MSTTAKLSLVSSVLVSTGIIGYIYYQQQEDKNRLFTGIVKDVQRQQQKKIKNTYVLQQQIELTKQFKEMERKELVDEKKLN